MAVTTTDRFGLTRWSADTDEVTRTQFDGSFASVNDNAAIDAQGLRAARPAPGTRGRYYQATDTGIVYRDDGTQWRVVGSRVTAAVLTPETATGVPLTTQGLTGQSGDLTQWQAADGTVLAAVSSGGTISATRLRSNGRTGLPAGTFTGIDPVQPVLDVQGAAGQTADLQRWLNQTGQTIARLGPTGALTVSGDIAAATLRATGDVTATGDITTTTGTLTGRLGRFTGDLAAPNLTGSATSPIGLHSYRIKTDAQDLPHNSAGIVVGFGNDSNMGTFNYGSGVWTIPTRGRWLCSASVSFEANANGARQLTLLHNGTGFAQARVPAGDPAYSTLAVTSSEVFAAGDTFSIQVLQTSGTTIQAGRIGGTATRATLDFLGLAP